MADSVTSQTIIDTDKRVVQKFTNLSDGSGETGVRKVDVSTLNKNEQGETCTRAIIDQIWYDIGGMRVILNFEADTVVPALILGGSAAAGVSMGHMDFRSFGGIKNNAGSGVNGDIKVTTSGHTNLDHYTIVLEMRKQY